MAKQEIICTKEAEISQIKTTLEVVEKVVMGNSHDGLNITVPLLAQNIEKLSGDMEKYTKVMTDLLEFQQRQEIEKDLKDKNEKKLQEEFIKKSKRNNIFIMIYMAIVATISFFASILIKN